MKQLAWRKNGLYFSVSKSSLKKKKKALHLHHRLHVDDTREHLKGEVQLAEKEKQTNQWDFILQ